MDKTKSVHIDELYTSPSIKVIDFSGEAIICTSTPRLNEDDEYGF